jgi:hypothetical protein
MANDTETRAKRETPRGVWIDALGRRVTAEGTDGRTYFGNPVWLDAETGEDRNPFFPLLAADGSGRMIR